MSRMLRTITVPCRGASLREVDHLVSQSLAGVRLPIERKDLIRRSIEETFDSMIRYSDHKGWDHDVAVTAEVDESRFRFVLAESRRDFAGLHPADDQPYRVGTTLARQVMSEISYTYKKGAQSELELVHAL